MTPAFAIIDRNKRINIATVSPTKIGAVVNWLYTNGYQLPTLEDEPHFKLFDTVKQVNGIDVIEVDVMEHTE